MNRLDYKDAPKGMLAVASTIMNCANCCGWAANNYCRFSHDVTVGQCSKYMRKDKHDVVFVTKSSEAYREAALRNFYIALDEIVARTLSAILVYKNYSNFKYGQLGRHLASTQFDIREADVPKDTHRQRVFVFYMREGMRPGKECWCLDDVNDAVPSKGEFR